MNFTSFLQVVIWFYLIFRPSAAPPVLCCTCHNADKLQMQYVCCADHYHLTRRCNIASTGQRFDNMLLSLFFFFLNYVFLLLFLSIHHSHIHNSLSLSFFLSSLKTFLFFTNPSLRNPCFSPGVRTDSTDCRQYFWAYPIFIFLVFLFFLIFICWFHTIDHHHHHHIHLPYQNWTHNTEIKQCT